jgi:predicted nucleotidyltransferase component of viral defense system
MIKTSKQLKALVRNQSKGDNSKALYIIRNYVMERFLERLSISQYKNLMVLKGGILVASMIGIDKRFTMDIDTTLILLPLNEENIQQIVEEIISINLEDGMFFRINKIHQIMGELEYPGIRVQLDAILETMNTPLKIDFSTGDIITPKEIEYAYPVMFEKRTIPLLAYNLETLLAEKIETMLSRGATNTRLRDFYDIYILKLTKSNQINYGTLKAALYATAEHRSSTFIFGDASTITEEISTSIEMQNLWLNYQKKFDYASELKWLEVMTSIAELVNSIIAH